MMTLRKLIISSFSSVLILELHQGLAGPDGPFVSTETCNLKIPGSNTGRAGYWSSWLRIYTVLLKAIFTHTLGLGLHVNSVKLNDLDLLCFNQAG